MLEGLVQFIEQGNFGLLLAVFGIYFLLIWILVPTWVFLDARKKFKNTKIALALFLLILPFNIPGLIFYIIVRPEDAHHSNHSAGNESFSEELIHIPVVNFVNDKKDLVMSFELKINGSIIKDEMKRDLNLDVNLNSDPETVVITHEVVKDEPVEGVEIETNIVETQNTASNKQEPSRKFAKNLTGSISYIPTTVIGAGKKIGRKLKSVFIREIEIVEETKEDNLKDNQSDDVKEEQSNSDTQQSDSKSQKKKKKKRK